MADARLTDYLRAQLTRSAAALGLDAPVAQLLWWLVPLEIDPGLAGELESADVYGRKGIVPWNAIATRRPDVQEATAAAFQWGLIEVVGALAQDPRTSGPAPLRLSHNGRTAVGLAPHLLLPARYELPDPLKEDEDWRGWTIMHSASREGVVARCAELLGPSLAPLWLETPTRDHDTWLHETAGRIAVRLIAWGAVVIDAYDLAQHHRPLLRELLRRTSGGPGVRVLLMPDPLEVRTVALDKPVRGVWVRPELDVRRDRMVADTRVAEAGLWKWEKAADSAGVPDSRVAVLRTPKVTRDDIVIDGELWARLDRCFQSARWRIGELEGNRSLMRHATGYRMLLSGPPGVGKSMFAEVLASELDKPLVRLDLSTVLSRWLGETEQHIAELFDVAEGAGAVLLMDECESLLKQRESGGGGGGALATGVAYLLTRMEAYAGILVATTNRVRDLDEAFFRRFDDHVSLSVPDPATRARLWERMLQGKTDGVDITLLAREFPIGGAMIRGSVLRGRSWAAAEDCPVETAVLLAAVVRELEKHERSWSNNSFRHHRDEMRQWLEASGSSGGGPGPEVKRPWQR